LATAIASKFTEDLRAMGLAASEAARLRYSWKTVFDRLFGIYGDVIDKFET
jgi:hypothetical protein